MLDAFFEFTKERKEYKWVHWNMRDSNYGFHAIELGSGLIKSTI